MLAWQRLFESEKFLQRSVPRAVLTLRGLGRRNRFNLDAGARGVAAKGTVGLGVEACGHAAGSLSDEHAAVRLDEADLDNRRNPVARRTAIIRSRCRWRRYDSSSATHANSGPVPPGFHSIPADARFVKVPYPNAFPSGAAAGPEARPLFCVLVSSNKALMVHDERDLYG